MSEKVVIDRELAELIERTWRAKLEPGPDNVVHGLLRLRLALAQPAEAEVVEVVAWAPSSALAKLKERHNNAPCILTDGPAEFNDTPLVPLASLSAVTAERDRLDADCGRLLEGKVLDAETIHKLEVQCDQLHAKVEGLRKNAERYAHLKAAWDADVLLEHLDSNVHPSDWDGVIDDAMAAKEEI